MKNKNKKVDATTYLNQTWVDHDEYSIKFEPKAFLVPRN